MFIQSSIFILKGSPCCLGHMVDGRLISDDLNKIRPREVIQIRGGTLLLLFSKSK